MSLPSRQQHIITYIRNAYRRLIAQINLWLYGPEPEVPQDDLHFASYAHEAVLLRSPHKAQQMLWACAACLSIGLLWAALAEVEEFTVGYGRVIPSRDIQKVQNLEGGIVSALLVQEGDFVEANQPLLRIDDTRFSSSYQETSAQLDHLKVKAARLRAEASGQEFIPPANLPAGAGEFVQRERELFKSRRAELNSNITMARQQAEQNQLELQDMKAQKSELENSYALLSRELALTRPLLAKGAISEVEVLRLERQSSELKSRLETAQISIPRLSAQLRETEKKIDSMMLAFRAEARKELNDAEAELQGTSASSEALEDRVKRTIVRSPTRGTVKRLLVKTIGGVIQPGMDIVEIVPIDDTLLVEARLKPADIAFIHPGQRAMVKVTAYDYSIHGGLDGTLVHISPDSIIDEKGDSYYIVRVRTNTSVLGVRHLPIIPGMTTEVDILTGHKTILDYLLKPILKTKQAALRER